MMVRGQRSSGRGRSASQRMSNALAVMVGLLSLRSTDSFLSAPVSSGVSGAPGGPGSGAAALRRRTVEARSVQQATDAGRHRAWGGSGDGTARHRLSATGVATDDNQGAVGSLMETQSEVSNNEMKPFVAKTRRDPRVWFDSIRDGAAPQPEALVELSKVAEAELAELALPTRKQEPYRYTDLESLYRTDFAPARIPSDGGGADTAAAEAIAPYLLEACKGQQMVFVNGVFSEELSDVSALAGVEGLVANHVGAMEGAELDQAKEMLSYLPEKDADFRTTQGSLPFACLNQACFADACVILVADGVTVEKPVQVLFFSEGFEEEPTVSHPRMVVKVGADAHLTLAQAYVSHGGVCFANGFTRMEIGDRGTVTHDYAEEMSASDRLVDTVSVDQTANSTYSINQLLSGAFDSRANFQIDLLASGSHCNVFTAALTTKNQRQDVHTTIRHKARGTTCLQEQRNVVADTADCVFKGRIVIDKTDANQLCRTLLVSDKARVTVMPSMEIIANDVKCTHGATICDLEEEELFYLMSRGISKIQAKTLVIKSFADIVIKRFMDPYLRERLSSKLLAAAPREDRATKGTYQSI